MWTKNLTDADDGFIVKQDWGLSKFSIKCTSSTAITVTGSGRVDSMGSEAIPIVQNDKFNYTEDDPLEDFTVGLSAGATAILIAFK